MWQYKDQDHREDAPHFKNYSDLLPVIVSHSSSTSVKNIEHFSQNLIHKRFNRFDYGTEENLIKYGTVLN